MKTVYILEDFDVIQTGDFARPLERLCDLGQHCSSWYPKGISGLVVDTLRWHPVRQILGEYWIGKTVGEHNNTDVRCPRLEFMRYKNEN